VCRQRIPQTNALFIEQWSHTLMFRFPFVNRNI
jgi:hypothetical protein